MMPKLRSWTPTLPRPPRTRRATSLYAFRGWFARDHAGVVNGALIFTMSIDDFVISYFTAGSQESTLSMVVYSMVRRRVSPEINALSTLMFVAVLVLLVVINLRQARQDAKASGRRKALGQAPMAPESIMDIRRKMWAVSR
ncbi:MAG: ABC transporter permease [Dysosmobacter welbionis]